MATKSSIKVNALVSRLPRPSFRWRQKLPTNSWDALCLSLPQMDMSDVTAGGSGFRMMDKSQTVPLLSKGVRRASFVDMSLNP
jgi:hypothetical protein